LDLETGGFTVLTGVSGSGKSSLAFDTLHVESQRRYAEVFSPALRSLMDQRPRPPFDSLERLPPSLAVAQVGGLPPAARSTLGTLTDAASLLAILYARRGIPHCPTCDRALNHTEPQAITRRLAELSQGTRLLVMAPVKDSGHGNARALLDVVATAGFVRVRVDGQVTRLEDVQGRPDRIDIVVDRIKVGPGSKDRIGEAVRLALQAGKGRLITDADGLETAWAERPWCGHCRATWPVPSTRGFSFRSPVGACEPCGGRGHLADATCTDCHGERLRPASRAVRLGGLRLPELLAAPCAQAAEWLVALADSPGTAPVAQELSRRLQVLEQVGLGYLSLDREGATLSSGELQRARLAAAVGSRLSGLLVVLDEPTSGLHPADTARLVQVLHSLREQGNTLLVVEHDAQVIRAADRVLEFGPHAGAAGGRVIFDGTPQELARSTTPTGLALSGRLVLPRPKSRTLGPPVQVRGARGRTLKNLSLDLPTRALTVFTGPSGAGKSTLVMDTLVPSLTEGGRPLPCDLVRAPTPFRRIVRVDATALGKSRHSTPATYTKLWSRIRRAYANTKEARIRGWGPGQFTLTRKGGRCEACGGEGIRRIDLDWLAPVEVTCETCDGRRFDEATLQVRLRGKDLSELLSLSVSEARQHLAGLPGMDAPLRALETVGLAYLALGQPSASLSGGESHRLRLARELAGVDGGPQDVLYVLDEPCTGLHPQDITRLATLLHSLVDDGGTVWVVEHDPLLVSVADHVVEMGPGAGEEGGQVVCSGLPADLIASADSLTGPWLTP
jgi:excinuclease ABC subunit A